ncbi:GTPase Era, involved in 16S rRNA processing [Singulisphaera sp. GP187]|uniref:GTPase n=1 Tax=Singulisphaera sp. GP187 TaxID=1882752 RepID=UPI0009293CC6|nr:GTPase [Singulisphaera sp. GP187]SIO61880.1 GTPase Era, involved in 16S rRNA processing [Singulisphaera sp. GP187]
MNDDLTKRSITRALERLSERIQTPRALAIRPYEKALIESFIERARGQWLGPSEPVLTVALAGGTGAGKSTLINAFAGTVIAEASAIRPTTRQLQAYHHQDDSLGALTEELASKATFVAHDRPELRHKMLVDTPDLDSFMVQHRATTKSLLKRSGLVLYVFSPERYLEERTWSILRTETEFSASAAILNKVDRIGSPEELEQITEDLRAHFAALGHGDIRIFRLCARAHVPDPSGVLPNLASDVDDMVALRAYLERELHGSEIARLLRRQREAVISHLRAEIDRIAPPTLSSKLEEVARLATARASEAGTRLAGTIAEPLAAVEAELVPLLIMHRHERFWGPFRFWLAFCDFISFGLTNLVRRSIGRRQTDRPSLIESTLDRAARGAVEVVLRSQVREIQDLLYANSLPIERWRELTANVDGTGLITEISQEIEAGFELAAVRLSEQGRSIIGFASSLGGLVPSAFVVIGLFVMTRDLFSGTYAGLTLLWHLLAMMILFFLALQGLVAVLLPGGTRWFGPSLGPQSVSRVISRTVDLWVDAYRTDLLADIADLREPLNVLQTAVNAEEQSL